MRFAAAHTFYKGRSRSPKKQVRFQSYVQAHSENTKKTFTSESLRVSASSKMTSCSDNMQTVQGMLGQKIINVLLDT